jgi:hypothetical protein
MSQTLSNTILNKQNIETLVKWYADTALIDIETEISKRLNSCDSQIYNQIINYLYEIRDTKPGKTLLNSVYIQDSLENVVNCLEWKIGVIYNYTNQDGAVLNISAIVGNLPYKYPPGYEIGYFKPSWLISDRTGLTLREVVSKRDKVKNKAMTLITTDQLLDNNIRLELLNNDTVLISVCVFLADNYVTYKSYPDNQPLSYRELQQIYPCRIQTSYFNHELINHERDIIAEIQSYNVEVIKTDTVKKLLYLLLVDHF